MHWTLLSPYLIECPAENPRIEWPIFPGLTIQVGDLSATILRPLLTLLLFAEQPQLDRRRLPVRRIHQPHSVRDPQRHRTLPRIRSTGQDRLVQQLLHDRRGP